MAVWQHPACRFAGPTKQALTLRPPSCSEAPGLDRFRPDQQTPVPNFYLAGSYTAQDYIDSMEGATLSGRQAAYKILANAQRISMRQPTELAQLATA